MLQHPNVGANLAVVLGAGLWLAAAAGAARPALAAIGVGLVALLVLLTRWEPSVLRAGVMAVLVLPNVKLLPFPHLDNTTANQQVTWGCVPWLWSDCPSFKGVPTMARKTTTTIPPKPTRTPRKAVKASPVVQDGNGRPKGTTARQRASKDGAKGKANRFDDLARAAAAGAGTADLTAQLQQSLDQAKAKPKDSPKETARDVVQRAHRTVIEADDAKAKPAKAAPKATSNGKTFKGRPTSNVDTIAQRAKDIGLRVRRDADIDTIAARLRATPDAVRAWMDTRKGASASDSRGQAKPKAPAKPAKATAPAKPAKPKATPKLSVRLKHTWADREPDFLRGCTLVVDYRVDPDDGHVWSQLRAIEGPDGKALPDRGRDLPIDFRPQREVMGNGRKVVLKDRTIAGLEGWLVAQGLAS
jgi:hypothetical protein